MSDRETQLQYILQVQCPTEVHIVDSLLSQHNLKTTLHIIIESNSGLEKAHQIAQASPRVEAMLFGGVDMAAELRCEASWEALLYARSRLVHAAAAAQLDLIDVPFLDLSDPEGLRKEATSAKALGFGDRSN